MWHFSQEQLITIARHFRTSEPLILLLSSLSVTGQLSSDEKDKFLATIATFESYTAGVLDLLGLIHNLSQRTEGRIWSSYFGAVASVLCLVGPSMLMGNAAPWQAHYGPYVLASLATLANIMTARSNNATYALPGAEAAALASPRVDYSAISTPAAQQSGEPCTSHTRFPSRDTVLKFLIGHPSALYGLLMPLFAAVYYLTEAGEGISNTAGRNTAIGVLAGGALLNMLLATLRIVREPVVTDALTATLKKMMVFSIIFFSLAARLLYAVNNGENETKNMTRAFLAFCLLLEVNSYDARTTRSDRTLTTTDLLIQPAGVLVHKAARLAHTGGLPLMLALSAHFSDGELTNAYRRFMIGALYYQLADAFLRVMEALFFSPEHLSRAQKKTLGAGFVAWVVELVITTLLYASKLTNPLFGILATGFQPVAQYFFGKAQDKGSEANVAGGALLHNSAPPAGNMVEEDGGENNRGWDPRTFGSRAVAVVRGAAQYPEAQPYPSPYSGPVMGVALRMGNDNN